MFHCRSISHHRAPLAIREQLSLTPAQQAHWLAQQSEVEVAILSTCNRLELYAHLPARRQMDTLWTSLLGQSGVDAADLASQTVALAGPDVAGHLFRVSCGLESMALGEPQILGQVTQAYEQAQARAAVGTALSLLFRAAIHAAKRVHTETAIGHGATSVGSLGIAKAEQTLGPLARHKVVVLGAGEMAQTIVKALVQRHVQDITLVSRTYENARRLADEWQVSARPITELKETLVRADVLFTTSGAPFTILAREDLEPVMITRGGRALCIVDIALPRDVDPNVADIPGVCLHDLDGLQQVIETNQAARQMMIPVAEDILQAEQSAFWDDYHGRMVAPTIRKLRERAEQVRQAELSRVYRRLPPDSERERLLFDQFSHRFMNKMLHQLTLNLKARAGREDSALLAAVAQDLFGLEDSL
jgi:glutamyl-tRNA reductase